MQKKTVKALGAAFALTAVAAGVHAQPLTRLTNNVTLYGIVDSGVETISNVGATHSRLTRIPTLSASLPSRLGFRGAEDLGGGLWAQFVLETGIGIDTGVINQGGRYFGRQAFVGLTHNEWGTLSFGRQYDSFYLATLDAGIFGPNAYGLGSLEPYIPAARFDNTIAYGGQYGNFGFNANYSLGRDVVPTGATVCAGESATDAQACRAYSAMLKYTTQTWGVASGYSRQKGGVGAAAGLINSNRNVDRATVNGYVRTGSFKFTLGWIGRDDDGNTTQPRANLYWGETSYALTPALALEGFIGQLRYRHSATGDRSTIYAARAVYSFSKRSAVYVTGGRLNNHGLQALSVSGASPGSTPIAGNGQTGFLVGVRTTF